VYANCYVRREEALNGKALSDIPALKPYWGKPAVRNFREGNGNVGIIRSPLRAFALPDQSSADQRMHLSTALPQKIISGIFLSKC
jgi:hypothetical protein